MKIAPIRHLSWNVNGIRSALRQGFLAALEQIQPHIICLQEIKANPTQVDLELKGYHQFWNPATKLGYSGTAVFSKIEPLNVIKGMTGLPDDEGRVLTLEFKDYFLVTVYTPNAKRDLSRLAFRHKEWDPSFLTHLKRLEKTKPVVFCGDLNVAHKEIDLANPKSNTKNAGFTPEEREGFDRLMQAGFVDTFRHYHQGPGHYTWWTWRNNARERNIGWRIDYFGISRQLLPCLVNSTILNEVRGSDHCPIYLELKLS